MQAYSYNGPVDTNVDFDTSHVKGKTAIVTGAAAGNSISRGVARSTRTACTGRMVTLIKVRT